MKILFCGDVVGRSGREVLKKYLPIIKKNKSLDLVIVNGENSAHGMGITPTTANELFSFGVDVITGGNHSWDKAEIINYINKENRLIRPINFPEGTHGKGYVVVSDQKSRQVLVINAQARLFMEQSDDPFRKVEEILKKYPLGGQVKAIVLDFHGEATSEKMAMAFFCDGRVSLVVGTHTHIPTSDAQILPKGTGYQTDAGMCGDYMSVVGMEIDTPLRRFLKKIPSGKLTPAMGEGTLCGVIAEIDDSTGLCLKIDPIIVGGRLKNTEVF
jgi:2',3'-cyclic-nucleotide 2'-phosphodiesterase